MDEDEWAQILKLAYENNGEYTASADVSGVDDNDEKRQRHTDALLQQLDDTLDLDTTNDELHDVLQTMSTLDLITYVRRNNRAAIRLKPDGFEVAFDQEQATRQQGATLAIGFLTGVLALTAIIRILILMMTTITGLLPTLLLSGVLLGVLGLLVLIMKSLIDTRVEEAESINSLINCYL